MIKKIETLFILFMISSCSYEGNLTKQEPITVDTVNNSLIKEPEATIKESIPIPEEPEMVKFEGDSGVLRGLFLGAEFGDYAHVSVLDTLGRFASFYVLSYHIDDDLWDAMMEGKYKDKQVEVSWKRENIFIEPIQVYNNEEVLTNLKFIE
ncbi:MAG: hypothetical protein NVV82_23860 [Sporocytophaga sp.]|nr:hypothetical protein [Sporocytophaga sp.]